MAPTACTTRCLLRTQRATTSYVNSTADSELRTLLVPQDILTGRSLLHGDYRLLSEYALLLLFFGRLRLLFPFILSPMVFLFRQPALSNPPQHWYHQLT